MYQKDTTGAFGFGVGDIPFRAEEHKVSYHMESLPFNNMDSLDLKDIRNCSSESDTQEHGKDGG